MNPLEYNNKGGNTSGVCYKGWLVPRLIFLYCTREGAAPAVLCLQYN